jgi:hypothetical protein
MEKSTKAKVNMAFRHLRKAGYFAEQNFWCCSTCAWADLEGGESDKAVFYHRQDNESWKGNKLRKDLYLSWSGNGSVIVNILEDVGLSVVWDGDVNKRIMVRKD